MTIATACPAGFSSNAALDTFGGAPLSRRVPAVGKPNAAAARDLRTKLPGPVLTGFQPARRHLTTGSAGAALLHVEEPRLTSGAELAAAC